jgi:hypothetical protein
VRWLERLCGCADLADRNRELLKGLAQARREAGDARFHDHDVLYAVRTELEIAQNRVKTLETEREVMLRAITGIGPELLRRLTDTSSEVPGAGS